MNGEALQGLAAGAIVLAAVVYLVVRRLRRRARPGAPCGDCPGCASGPQAPADGALVRIGEPDAKRR